MPFDFFELFTTSVRSILPRLQAKKLAFAFDCHGPQLTVPGDPVAMRCSLHRLLGSLVELIDVGFLVFDAETASTPSGEAVARMRLAGTGLPAGAEMVAGVLRRLGLQEVEGPAKNGGATRRAGGECPRTGALIDFLNLGKDGLMLRAEWVDAEAERWDITRPLDARGAPAWLINENAMGGRLLGRRLQRLGWAPRTFGSVAQARRALQTEHSDMQPALVVAVESSSLSHVDLKALARLLPSDTQCIHAVAPGSPTLRLAQQQLAGFDIRVYPLSPWELHQITERLCELRRLPWRPTLPYPVVQEERPRLLVVDDNPLTRLFARSLGEGLGYDVASAPDGASALSICEQWSPDVVLMDVHMSPWSGIETTRRLRELQSDGLVAPCAVVAVTADDSEATRQACLDAGMDGHLIKPLLLPTLVAELSRVCTGHGRLHPEGVRPVAQAALLPREPLRRSTH